jgi:hypothetical protein
VRVACALLLILWTSVLQGQGPRLPRTLETGTVVRFHLGGGKQEGGRLLAPFAPDSTTFRYCRYPAPPCEIGGLRYVERPLTDVRGIDLHRGTRAPLGGYIGGGFGFFFGLELRSFSESMAEHDLSTGEDIGIVAGSTLFFGLIGVMIGAMFTKWAPIQ